MTKPTLPYGPDAPTKDYVGLAFSAVAFGITAGTGVMALVLFAVRSLQVGLPPSETPDLHSAAANVLLYGTGIALFLAGFGTWTLLRPTRSAYRQGGLAMVAAFATLVVSLVTMPVDRLVGRWGLAAVAALCALGAWKLAGRAVRQIREA